MPTTARRPLPCPHGPRVQPPRLTEHLAVRAEVRGYGALVNDDSQFLQPEIRAFRVRGS